jgi:hypothetical protein
LIIRLGEAGLHDFLAFSPKVRPKNVRQSAGVTPLQRVQNSFVLLHRKRPMFGRHRGDEARAPDPCRDRFIKSGEHRVIGGSNDAFMDKAIPAPKIALSKKEFNGVGGLRNYVSFTGRSSES